MRLRFFTCGVLFFMLYSYGCGGGARPAAQSTSSPQTAAVEKAGDVTLSVDPTDAPVTRLQNALDTIRPVNPGDYVLGAGDKLRISILARNFSGEKDENEVIVRQDGKVYLKLIGEVQAAGRTIATLQDSITRSATAYIKEPFVQITVTEFNSQYVTIFGELGGGQGGAGRSIRIPLKGPTRLVELFSITLRESGQAQGNFAASPSITADLSNIIITRRSGERLRVNLNTYLFGMNTASNIELYNGDFVFIPNINDYRVFVLGEVSSPGPVPIGLGLTASEAVIRAGGFTRIARRNDVKIIRGGLENPTVLSAAVLDVASRGRRNKDVPLRNGDMVYIPRNPLGDINLILEQIIPPLQTYLIIQALIN